MGEVIYYYWSWYPRSEIEGRLDMINEVMVNRLSAVSRLALGTASDKIEMVVIVS